jgi:serine/threonine protein kinase
MAELSAGTVLNNRYELEEMIGRGGFAVVWLARDRQDHKEYRALKLYAPDKGLDDSSMELFEQEYQLAQQLRDSRLLRATDYFHYGASPVLVFPYCSHGSALHYLQRHGPLPEEVWRASSTRSAAPWPTCTAAGRRCCTWT